MKVTRSYDDVALRMTETTEVGLEPARSVESQWQLVNGQAWTRTVTLPSGRQQQHVLNDVGQVARVERASGGHTTLTWLGGNVTDQRRRDEALARA